MAEQAIHEKMTFRDYYMEQPLERKKMIRDKFLQFSGLSFPAWYTKLNRRNYSKLEQGTLESICETEFNWSPC